ncbi:hypothetical protein FR932_13525 [Moritella marina ATCC 15381]|uniref:TniQ family protein n=1 Tax=Moritella marina ATCC 15381 TaxID=1202962 RepID=A0A5J6WNQ2_MORMI|nr:hypothetical protein [Moritella marina]QFI38798.1 hypothetical protein FR932_13525 [Moritella marina ATCC 15381]
MNLPVFNLLPNEHLLSWLVRAYKLSGYSSFLNFQETLGFQDRFLYSNQVFTPASKGVINLVKERDSLVRIHTVIPIWQVSVGQILEKNDFGLGHLGHASEMTHFGFGFDISWHSCKKCREYDLDKYGTTYWHSWHQLPSVLECYKHNRILEKGKKSIRNLFKATLPHQVNAWEPIRLHISKELSSWQSFVFKINEISHERPTIAASIKFQLIELLGLNIESSTIKSFICKLYSPHFESYLGPELIKHIFRNYTNLILEGRRDFLSMMFIHRSQTSLVRNPVYLIALAYWQRANLNFD